MMAQANVALSQLRDVINAANGDYFLTKLATPLTITSGVATLPADCLRLKWLFLLEGTQRRPIVDYRMDRLIGVSTTQTDIPRAYKQTGLTLQLIPAPPAGTSYTVELWYDADLTPFTATSTPVPSLIYPGWEEFIVAHLAAKISVKEETDPAPHMSDKQMIAEIVKSAVVQRNELSSNVTRITKAPMFDTTSSQPPYWGIMY
jgi:hypothetical protein